jgi:hypothetical protein
MPSIILSGGTVMAGHTSAGWDIARRSIRMTADPAQTPWTSHGPGYLVGGPHPGPADWHDEQEDYRTNEIAINWTGALIYALAAALDSAGP